MIGPLLLAVLVPVLLSGPGRCGTCHPDIRVLFERSIHAAEGAVCTDCHGGNSNTLVVEQAHRGKFGARPARKNIPKLCARCHSDIVRMKPYNLPADQLALYQTSRHGQLLAQGDERVAVCTDCHGVHDILSPRNPVSPVAPRNIPQTCGHCHGDSELMG
ncbi:MAG: cytochrome c3 family protein, partial [Acidobacteriota bacterium]